MRAGLFVCVEEAASWSLPGHRGKAIENSCFQASSIRRSPETTVSGVNKIKGRQIQLYLPSFNLRNGETVVAAYNIVYVTAR